MGRVVETIREAEVGQVCQELQREDLRHSQVLLLHPRIQVPPVVEEVQEALLLHHPIQDPQVAVEVQEVQVELEPRVSTK